MLRDAADGGEASRKRYPRWEVSSSVIRDIVGVCTDVVVKTGVGAENKDLGVATWAHVAGRRGRFLRFGS